MADNTKDVELRIRAKDYSQKTLEQLTDTLVELIEAQEDQADAARKGETTARQLEKAYQALEDTAKGLIGKNTLINQFNKQTAALAEQKQKVEAAREEQDRYNQTLANATTLTNKQITAVNKNNTAVKTAEEKQRSLENSLAATTVKLHEAGIASDDIAKAQQTIVTYVGAANTAMGRQGDILESLEDDQAKYRAELQRTKETQDAMRRSQETDVANVWIAGLDAQIARQKESLALREKELERQDESDRKHNREREQTRKQFEADRAFAAAQQAMAAQAKRDADAQVQALRQQQDALDKAADEAERLARSFAKIAAGGKSTFATGLADSLRNIADPASAAVKSIQGIETALSGTEAKIAAINGPIKEYKATLEGVEAAQRSLLTIAGQVDAYQRQMTAVAAARAELQRARQAMADLVAQARAGTGGEDITVKMNAAQGALKRASVAMAEETTKAHTMRDALKAAGVATQDLSAAQAKLLTTANRARGAIEGLEKAYLQHGAAVDKSTSAMGRWFGGGRTTLSFMQRIRGELIGLGTAYIGVQAAVGLATRAVEVYQKKQAIEQRLGQVVGQDAALIKKEWDFLAAEADRLGFSFFEIAESYGRFAIAAKAGGATLQETHFIFEKFAEGARVSKLSTEEFEGALKAIEQMMSKGTIQAEELRGQLGDRLPGAMAKAIKAYGQGTEAFIKAMEAGEVSAKYVIDIAREMGEDVKGGVELASKSLVAVAGRLQTAKDNFVLALGQAGFIDAFSEFMTKLTKLLQSPEGKELAEDLSKGFTLVLDVLGFVVDNLDLVKTVLLDLVRIKAAMYFANAAIALWDFRKAAWAATLATGSLLKSMGAGFVGIFTVATGAVGTAGTVMTATTGATWSLTWALRALSRAIPIIGAAIIAYDIVSALLSDDKDEDFEKAGKEHADKYKKGFNEGVEDPGTSGKDDSVYKSLGKQLAKREKEMQEDIDAERMKAVKKNLAERLKLVDEEYEKMRVLANKGIPDELARAERLRQIDAANLKARALEAQKFRNEQAKGDDEDLERKKRLAADIASSLERIQDDVDKRAAEADPSAPYEKRRLARVEAIGHAYDEVLKKIRQGKVLGLEGMDEAEIIVQDVKKERQDVESNKVALEEIGKLEANVNEQLEIRNTLNEQARTLYDEGVISFQQMLDRTTANNTAMQGSIGAAATQLSDFATVYRHLMDPEKYTLLMANLAQVQAKNNSVAQNHLVNLNGAQEEYNKLMQDYEQQSAKIQADAAAHVITQGEAIDKQAELNAKSREGMIAQAEAVKAMAIAATTPQNEVAMKGIITNMDAIIAKAKDAEFAMTDLQLTVSNELGQAISSTFDQGVNSLEQMVTGQQSVSDGFKEMGRQSILFFAQFMRDIALAMLKQQLLKAMQSSGNIYLQGAATAMGGTKHGGGIIGMPGPTRLLPASIFEGAARFHNGGMPGLQANEVPTILQKGEEVLARDDPRHAYNGGGAQGGMSKFVLVDDRARVAEAMTGTEGENVTMVHLRNNLPTLKQWMR